jgi:hypothetical protein
MKSPIDDFRLPMNLSDWFDPSIIYSKREDIANLIKSKMSDVERERDVVLPEISFYVDSDEVQIIENVEDQNGNGNENGNESLEDQNGNNGNGNFEDNGNGNDNNNQEEFNNNNDFNAVDNNIQLVPDNNIQLVPENNIQQAPEVPENPPRVNDLLSSSLNELSSLLNQGYVPESPLPEPMSEGTEDLSSPDLFGSQDSKNMEESDTVILDSE